MSRAQVAFRFPDADLLPVLIDKYFEEINTVMPLLIRPAFEQDVASGLHYYDQGFASVLLMICAIGSRYIHDSRVCVEGDTSGASSGWRYFNQVEVIPSSVFAPPRLTDIQLCAVR
jgi:hypothetical protein